MLTLARRLDADGHLTARGELSAPGPRAWAGSAHAKSAWIGRVRVRLSIGHVEAEAPPEGH